MEPGTAVARSGLQFFVDAVGTVPTLKNTALDKAAQGSAQSLWCRPRRRPWPPRQDRVGADESAAFALKPAEHRDCKSV
jgi:hypothetical protein